MAYQHTHILSIYAPTAINAHSNETMSFTTDSLQLSMQSQHVITFSYVVTSTQHCLSMKFLSKNRCGEANRNTKMLQSFIERHDMLTANAYTRQKHRSVLTFDGKNGRKTRLDWIFFPLSYRFNLQTSNTHKTSVITSDHCFVTASIS